jgi:D-alanyl-D-alanine dipeptidase
MPVELGRHGLAWGLGIHPLTGAEKPLKREGDGKAPAGIFRMRHAFGYAPPGEVPWIRLPYRQVHPGTLCIDDPASASYNRILETGDTAPDWHSHEAMLREDGLYRLRRGPASPTEGCTALAEPDLERVLRWLDPEARPVLIQLPGEEYEKRRKTWSLP